MSVTRIMTEILSLDISQDSTTLGIGTSESFAIYSLSETPKLVYKPIELFGSVSIIRLLNQTSLVLLVGAGYQPHSSPRRLSVYNTRRNSIILNKEFESKINDLKLNSQRVVLLQGNEIHVFDLNNFILLFKIPAKTETISFSSKNLIAFPTNCQVNIYNESPISIFTAHNSNITHIVFSCNNEMIATCSEKGTVVKIFSINGALIHEYKRGSIPCKINYLRFSNDDSSILCASDSKSTHLFSLKDIRSDIQQIVSNIFNIDRELRVAKTGKEIIVCSLLNGFMFLVSKDATCYVYTVEKDIKLKLEVDLEEEEM